MAFLQSLRGSLRGGLSVLRAIQAAGTRGMASAADGSISVEVREFKGHKVDPPSNTVTTTKEELLWMYEMMFRMRRMEIAADQMYKKKLIRGFCHLYDGQEAICVGMEAAITKNDSIVTSYRDHCQHLGRGGTVKEVIAELFGRTDGISKGMGGSMHMYKKDANFYGGNGIVGAQIPLGAGLGFGHKYRDDGGVAFALYGDGAANQGQKYEALNISALWKLPTIFVCENNRYGMGTAIWRAAFKSEFYTRGDYVPGINVDGMDALAVKQACAYAKEYALANGPIILEMETYRYHGHSMSDPGSTYRTRDEVQGIRKERDPIGRVSELIKTLGLGDGDTLKKLENGVKAEIDAAVKESSEAPIPPNDWLYRNIYVKPEGAMMRGVDSSARFATTYHPQ